MSASWQLVTTTILGESHQRDGSECQDSSGVWSDPDWGLVLTVADGAGGAPLSHRGSRYAVTGVERALRHVHPVAWDSAAQVTSDTNALMQQALNIFRGLQKATGNALRDYASTLAFVVVRPPWVGVAMIGDAFLIVSAADQLHLAVPPSQRGQYANEATFITNDDPTPDIKAIFEPDLDGLFLSTDGLEKLLRPVRVPADSQGLEIAYAAPDPGLFDVMLQAVREGADRRYLDKHLAHPQVRTMKGDDIGVAVAARR